MPITTPRSSSRSPTYSSPPPGIPSGGAYNLEKALGTKPDWIPALALYGNSHCPERFRQSRTAHQDHCGEESGIAPRQQAVGETSPCPPPFPAALNHYANVQRKEILATSRSEFSVPIVAAGEPGKGMGALGEAWHREHPENLAVLRILARRPPASNNLKAARTAYEKILPVAPTMEKSSTIWPGQFLQQGDTGAFEIAERAVAARPQDARFIDTLGWIQGSPGARSTRGLPCFAMRDCARAANADICFHLACALNRVGRKAEAQDDQRSVQDRRPIRGRRTGLKTSGRV